MVNSENITEIKTEAETTTNEESKKDNTVRIVILNKMCIRDSCHIRENRFSELMNETEILTKDVGSILVGKQTVKEGIIDEIGGLKDAMKKLYELVDRESNK